MTAADSKTKKPAVYVGIGIGAVLAVAVVVGFFVAQQQTTNHQNSQYAAVEGQEEAYQNVIKDMLKVYRSRYDHYPKDYQTLLDDIDKSRNIYGVNDEGMSELKNITDRLNNFSYSSESGGDAYAFTYQKANTGETAMVKSS